MAVNSGEILLGRGMAPRRFKKYCVPHIQNIKLCE
jgi:hypothetical protein